MNRLLAEVARREALRCFHGNAVGAATNLHPIADLFPYSAAWTIDSWDNCWCAAFVFYCIRQAGYSLPVRYPDERVTAGFGCVGAWEQWAKLPEQRLWLSDAELPQAGDLVLFDRVFDGNAPDHIAIVLAADGASIETAEGNFNNVSAIVRRDMSHVRGFIRMAF